VVGESRRTGLKRKCPQLTHQPAAGQIMQGDEAVPANQSNQLAFRQHVGVEVILESANGHRPWWPAAAVVCKRELLCFPAAGDFPEMDMIIRIPDDQRALIRREGCSPDENAVVRPGEPLHLLTRL